MKPRLVVSVVLLALVAGILAACAGATNSPRGNVASPTSPLRNVQVTILNGRIALSQTTFSTGVRYHFVVTNDGSLQQECMIMPHWMGQMPVGAGAGQVLDTTNVIPPRVTQAFDYTFSPAMAPEQLQFNCYSYGRATVGTPMLIR